MKFDEENYARNLHRELKAQCPRGTKLHLQGSGDQWSCGTTRGHRTGSIICLHQAGSTPGPEYLISFQQHHQQAAVARVFTQEEAVSATVCWLDGHPIDILHKQFAFVDAQQRALTELRKTLITHSPDLGTATTHELRKIVNDIYYLLFVAQERSCRISYVGRNPQPDAIFFAEGTELFRFTMGETDALAEVMKAWLCDTLLLSQIRVAFPQVNIPTESEVAEARSLEGKFLHRWNAVTGYYQNGKFPFAPVILPLVTAIRWAGYDRKLNVQPGERNLFVARLRNLEKRAEHPYILFTFYPEGMLVQSPGRDDLPVPEVKLTPELDTLLRQLAAGELA